MRIRLPIDDRDVCWDGDSGYISPVPEETHGTTTGDTSSSLTRHTGYVILTLRGMRNQANGFAHVGDGRQFAYGRGARNAEKGVAVQLR